MVITLYAFHVDGPNLQSMLCYLAISLRARPTRPRYYGLCLALAVALPCNIFHLQLCYALYFYP